IRLNVRGICVLRPGVAGVSDNIEVISIVDRFLEHARIYYFQNGGDDELYLASADWMNRNLDKRIEIMFPVETDAHKRAVLEVLRAMFRDNVKARKLSADGSYKRVRRAKGDTSCRVQQFLQEEAHRTADLARERSGSTLQPNS